MRRARERGSALVKALGFGLLLAAALPALICAETCSDRYFLVGDGKVHIRNAHNGQEASVVLLAPDGSLNEEAFKRIDEAFGFPGGEKGEHVSPRLIFMLDHFSDLVAPGKVINLISGYRSPEYNEGLRNAGGNVAKTSLHLDGMALDFNIEGVNGKDLWNLVKSKDCCGIGHYGGANVHLDSARPRFWEADTSKVRSGESEANRRIHLSTDMDRYRPGETARLSFASASEFRFGISRSVGIVKDAEGKNAVSAARVKRGDEAECIPIDDRTSSRFILLTLPTDLPQGRYRVRVDFCKRPVEGMPTHSVSNEIEILARTP